MKRFFVATFTAIALLVSLSLLNPSHQTVDAQGKGEIPSPALNAPGIIRHEVNHAGADNVTAGGTTALSPISYHSCALINTPTAVRPQTPIRKGRGCVTLQCFRSSTAPSRAASCPTTLTASTSCSLRPT